MSGSPHGVFGWTQPFGVAMKWLASLAAPRIESSVDLGLCGRDESRGSDDEQ